MKTVTVNLYRFSELATEFKEQAMEQYNNSFISAAMPIDEVWFTITGLIYPIFNV